MVQESGLEEIASCWGQASALVRVNVSHSCRRSVCCGGLGTGTGPILEIGQRERTWTPSGPGTKSNAPRDH